MHGRIEEIIAAQFESHMRLFIDVEDDEEKPDEPSINICELAAEKAVDDLVAWGLIPPRK